MSDLPLMATLASAPIDFYGLNALLTEEERAIRQRVRGFCEAEVLPYINDYWERAEFPFAMFHKLAGLNIAGGAIHGYGCPGFSRRASYLVNLELARADASLTTAFGVHSGLAMNTIAMFGSEEQKQRWLPAMARLDKIGAWALTEPEVGSDAAHLRTRARRSGDTWLLNGAKRWIGNASFADVVVIWARDEQSGQVNAFLLEKGTPGFDAAVIQGKIAKRAVWNADIKLTEAEVPEGNRLPGARGFRATAEVLRMTRPGVAAEAVGHAMAAYELALSYARRRQQFGRPIAGYQLIQQKLVLMLAEITAMQALLWRLADLAEADAMSDAQASLAKMHCAAKARQVVALGREILGGNGILLDNHLARHFADMEAVYTYEGTNEINTLVVGREITGLNAFS